MSEPENNNQEPEVRRAVDPVTGQPIPLEQPWYESRQIKSAAAFLLIYVVGHFFHRTLSDADAEQLVGSIVTLLFVISQIHYRVDSNKTIQSGIAPEGLAKLVTGFLTWRK